MHGTIPSTFSFTGFSAVVPYEPLEVQAHMLRLRLLGDTRQACLVRTWCSLVSIPSSSSDLDFPMEAPLCLLWEFSGILVWRVLGVIRRAFLAHSRIYLAQLSVLYPSWGDSIFQESSMESQTACYWPCRLERACFLTVFIRFSWGTALSDQGA